MNTEIVINIDDNFLKKKNIKFDFSLHDTRGLCLINGDIYINLGAEQFETCLYMSEDMFIKEFGKTVLHEHLHSLIREECDGIDNPIEEKYVGILSEQIEGTGNDKIATFIN